MFQTRYVRSGLIGLVLAPTCIAPVLSEEAAGAPRPVAPRLAALSLEQAFSRLDNRIRMSEQIQSDGSSFVVVYAPQLPGPRTEVLHPEHPQDLLLSRFSWISRQPNGTEIALGVGGFTTHYFGAGALDVAPGTSMNTVPALANPYLLADASHAAIAQDLGGGVKVKVGLLTSGFGQALPSQSGTAVTPISTSPMPQANTALIEVSKSFGTAAMSMAFLRTNESNAYLGAQSSGALGFGSYTETNAIQLAGAIQLAPKLALAGQIAYGYTLGKSGIGNLISEVSGNITDAYSVAVVAADRLKSGDRFSIALSQPMRTYSGKMIVDMLTGNPGNGAQTPDRLNFSMVPIGREMRLELSYQIPSGKDASTGLTFLVRRNPNNLDSSLEKLLAVRYVKQF